MKITKKRISAYIVITAKMLKHYEVGTVGWNQTMNHLMRRVDEYEAIDATIRAEKEGGRR